MRKQLLAVMVIGCFCIGPTFAEDKAADTKAKDTKESKAQLPKEAKGFAGMISGKIITEGKDQVVIEVTKIDHVWKHNKAEKAESLVGKQVTIKIVPSTYEKKEGYLPKVQKFFALLKKDHSNSFDVKNTEGDSLTFLELTKAQAEQVEKVDKLNKEDQSKKSEKAEKAKE